MASTKKIQWTIIVLFIFVAGLLGIKYFTASQSQAQKAENARIKGPKDAQLYIVEYIDFECPACAAGAKMIQAFMKEHPNLIRLEMKYFPLSMHNHAYLSAQYAECAAYQDEFWSFHDELIDRQQAWSRLINAKPAFDQIAQDIGLDMENLTNCLESEKVNRVIDQAKEDGLALKIRSTPSYVVNGKLVVGSKSLQRVLIDAVEGKN